jgi:hypothetical protein
VSEAHLPRRRRSVTRTPAFVDPADVPDDAAGRIEVIAVRAPADVLDAGDAEPAAAPAPSINPRTVAWLLSYHGWVAAGVLVAILLVLFIIGMKVTH